MTKSQILDNAIPVMMMLLSFYFVGIGLFEVANYCILFGILQKLLISKK